MEEIYLEDEIAALEPKKVIVSVFILSGYDRSAYKWVLDTWKQIDEDTGANWVLLVPVNRRGSFPREIDVSLSDRIREMYGIDRQQTPCLVFDNFVEDEHQKVLSLKGGDDLLKNMMLSMKERIDVELNTLGDAPRTDRWRYEVTDKLFRAGQWSRDESGLLTVAKKAFSLVSSGAMKFAVGKIPL